ncbi:CynX/NimT family MFS transporter [Paenibacillus sp. 32352]|uniref:MFS transporter n=1 Tax=Paenibacillus sp. 32352 TaxID=1969111 RepID=UPI0009ACEC08|nr:MFS transporter [Paenibacillus sp. 32352]
MKYRFGYLLCALFLASLNLRPAISSISPLLETIRNDLGMNGSVASLLTSIPVLCMGVFSPLAVKLSSRWGLERILTLSLIVIGLGTVLRFSSGSSALLLVTAFLSGLGIAICGPLLSGFIKKYFADRAASIVGIYSMALVLGAALSAGLSVPLQSVMHGSWKASLAIWALFAIIALPIWIQLSLREKRAAGAAQGVASNESRLPLRSKRAWLLTAFFGLMAWMFYSMTAWLAPAMVSLGYDKGFAGGMLTLFTVIQIPVSFFLPMLIARFPKRMYWLLGCALLELAGVILFITHANPWLIVILLGLGAGGLFPMALMLPIEETDSAEAASALSAMNQSGGYIVGSLGPLFVGWVHDKWGGFEQAFGGLAVLIVIMLVLQLNIGNKKKQTPAKPAARMKAEVSRS